MIIYIYIYIRENDYIFLKHGFVIQNIKKENSQKLKI